MTKSTTISCITALLIYIFLAVYITYPLIFHLENYITSYGDELLIAWIQNWVQHALLTDPLNMFQANIFYPFPNSLAYSDIFFTSSLLSFIPVLLLKQPVVAVNFTLISSLIMLGFSMFLLTYYMSKNWLTSLYIGILVVCSPAVLDKYVHLQILTIFWLPLSILFFLHYLKTRRIVFFLLTLLCFIFQTYNSFMPGYFIVISLSVIYIFCFLQNKKQTRKLFKILHILLFMITALLILPIIIPYYQISNEFHYVRDLRDAIHFGLQPEDFITTNAFSRFYSISNMFSFNHITHANTEIKPGFLGGVFTLLTIITIIYFIKKWKKIDYITHSFAVIALIGFILSLVPFLHINRYTIHYPFPVPLPYLLFYYLAPGFQGFRNSARFEMLFIIFWAVSIGYVLHVLLKNRNNFTRKLILIILILATIMEYNFPMHFLKIEQINNFPKVYLWLKQQPMQYAAIEMPIYNWNMTPYASQEQIRDYYAAYHLHKIVNGASGYSPEPWQKMITKLLVSFPDNDSIIQLKGIHIKYIIVHKSEYNLLNKNNYIVQKRRINPGNQVVYILQKISSIKLTKQFGDDYIYQIY